ncbi:MAG: hypothetical protein Q8P62_01870 [Candidatus Peregrinibacteria bacterium]|nr:hypothetical protein [Candidatus Peregrinibacteria bacterium]
MTKQTKVLLSIVGVLVVGALVLASSNSGMFQGRMSRNITKSGPPVNVINPFLTENDFRDLMAKKKIYVTDEISYLTMKSSDSTTPIKRADAVKLLVLAYENIKGPSLISTTTYGSPAYSDIGSSGRGVMWYYSYIQEAAEVGIIIDSQPWEGNNFFPNDSLKKSEAQKMIDNLANVLK